jgi:hypothetical protein
MTTYNITTPIADLPFEMKQTFAGEFVFVKNPYVAYLLDNTGFNLITDTDYPSYHSYAVTSITRSGSTATVTTTGTNTLEVGNTVVISGAVETAYNGTFTITGITTPGSVFTYTVSGTPATPATGTINAYGGWTTVPGIVYLDDYIFVGRVDGEIQNCNRAAFTVWDALDFFTPDKEPSLLVRIAKSLNFLVAFKTWDTQFYYNADVAPPGSPLLEQESAYLKLGCAAAYSVVEFDGGIVFVSQRDQLQRSREVHVLNGLTPKKISTPNVERILNESTLAGIKSLYLSTAGHQLYVLTMPDVELTLVYDFNNGFWYQWTYLTLQSSQSVISLTSEGTTATASVEDHGFSDGDPVLIAGATPDAYNGIVNVTVIDDNTFTYTVADTTSPATGTITASGYDESYFPAVAYATYQNLDLVLHETNGILYALDTDTFSDTDAPINVLLRLAPWDGGNKYRKTFSHIRAVGDLTESDVLIRHSNDDYETWSTYRKQSMASQYSMLRKLGQGRRRAWEMRHTADTAGRWEALDQDFRQGF